FDSVEGGGGVGLGVVVVAAAVDDQHGRLFVRAEAVGGVGVAEVVVDRDDPLALDAGGGQTGLSAGRTGVGEACDRDRVDTAGGVRRAERRKYSSEACQPGL